MCSCSPDPGEELHNQNDILCRVDSDDGCLCARLCLHEYHGAARRALASDIKL